MILSQRYSLLVMVVGALALAGCRAPLAVNRALVPRRASIQNKKFFGIWELRQRSKGTVKSVVCVYPLGKRRYLVTWSIYKTGAAPAKPDLKGEAVFISSLTEVRGRLWMSCRTMDPRLLYSASMQRWWAGRLPAGQPRGYGSALKKMKLKMARANGMGRIFYLVELGAVSPDRLDVYPLLVPTNKGGQSTFKVPVAILKSRKNLRAFLDSRTLAHLLPRQPWIFVRLTESQADAFMPAQ